jgi:hypothetical protein
MKSSISYGAELRSVSADKASAAIVRDTTPLFAASFTNGKPVYFKEKAGPQRHLSKFITEV